MKHFGRVVGTITLVLLVSLCGRGLAMAEKPTLTAWGRALFTAGANEWMVQRATEWGKQRGVEVKVVLLPPDEFNRKIMGAVAAGMEPDIAIHGWPMIEFAEDGLLLPVDDIIQKLEPADIYEIKLRQVTYGEHYYGIPWGFQIATFMHTRKDVLENAGIPIKDPIDPLWVRETAIKVTRPERDFYGHGYSLGRTGDTVQNFLQEFYWFGGEILTELSPEGVVFKDQPAAYRAVENLLKQWDARAIPPDAIGWASWHNNKNYIEGRIAMTMNPCSVYYGLVTENNPLADKTVLLAYNPTIDSQAETFFIFKSTKYPELAKDLAYYMFSDKDEYRRGYCEGSSLYCFPIFKSQIEKLQERWVKKDWPRILPNIQRSPIELAASIKRNSQMLWPYNKPSTVGEKQFWEFRFSDMLSKILVNREPVEKALEWYHNKLVEDMKRYY